LLDGGRLRLTKMLGSGAFAVVYLAEETAAPHRKLAVKCLPKPTVSATEAAALLQFQRREAVLLQRLCPQPNITHLYRTLTTRDAMFLILEWCDADLFDVIVKGDTPLLYAPDHAARTVFLQLIDAVLHCHKHGIFHRDLKPENVLLDDLPSLPPVRVAVKLSDFGLATQAKRCKDFGCGSRHYMAPEALADGAAATAGGHYHPAAADVWSLGVILINILTGKNLWLSPDPSDPHFAAW
ncbi:hypothetical protein CXG81DRAFT_6124, partial [Caulochytrium protostelioides]